MRAELKVEMNEGSELGRSFSLNPTSIGCRSMV